MSTDTPTKAMMWRPMPNASSDCLPDTLASSHPKDVESSFHLAFENWFGMVPHAQPIFAIARICILPARPIAPIEVVMSYGRGKQGKTYDICSSGIAGKLYGFTFRKQSTTTPCVREANVRPLTREA
ncbi:hypothetical protein ACERK3_12755 [Phycisphaerales bacterium AB-hyl4]|uniref:Uncharacterized protein n=1 Tax=Natronomicrosphaera hydrolytica TaxID=3242702 RepID=A0ABV4U7P6_9BACT